MWKFIANFQSLLGWFLILLSISSVFTGKSDKAEIIIVFFFGVFCLYTSLKARKKM